MITAAAVVAVAVAGGAIATFWFDPRSPGYARLATGAFLGLTALSFVAFVLALVIGFGPLAVVLATAVTALPLIGLGSARTRAAVAADLAGGRSLLGRLRRPTAPTIAGALYVAALVLGVWLVSDRTFFGRPDGLHIGNVNNLGDLPYHVGITTGFAYGANFPPQNPVFAGSGFSYHYMADFLAAVFVGAGASIVDAMLLMNVVLLLALLTLVHRWVRELTGSDAAAAIAPLLLVFSGGLGWLTLLAESRASGEGVLETFLASDARYTMQDGVVRFGNAITTLLLPQRGLLLGMGLAIVVFGVLWRQLDEPAAESGGRGTWRARLRDVPGWRAVLVAGVLTGLLPIVHMHTFAVVLGTAFLLGVIFRQWREDRWRAWAVYVIAAVVVALPVLLWTARGSQASATAFIGVHFGWERGERDPITFWLMNTGVFIPLLIAAFVWRGDRPLLSRKLLMYALPFVIWFALANVLRLAPWIWDNIKVFIYWWLGGVPLVALLLVRLWREHVAGKLAAVALAIVLVAAGALDVARASVGPTYLEFDPDGIAFAEQIREVTPPRSVILTAPSWNTPVFLAGRPVFMGYTGFLFANGLPYGDREPELRAIYAGEAGAEALLDRHGIGYIVVGPQERTDVAPNDDFLSRFPVVASVGEYALHATGR